MKWEMAPALEKLLSQINELSPNRDKSSDGGIGNAEHSARASDHNPDDDGFVKARDFTHDPAHGIDSEKLANALLTSRDRRIKYIISNKKIASGSDGPAPWIWRPYTGKNPHNHHCHVSVKRKKEFFADASPWKFNMVVSLVKASAPVKPVEEALPTLRKGDKNVHVADLQKLLGLFADGQFGPKTEEAVKLAQKKHGLVADGVVGKYTWEKLKG